MGHELVRATILPDIIRKIMTEYCITEEEALDSFYSSDTGMLFSKDESGLYGQSALYVFSLYQREKKHAEAPLQK